MSKVLIIAEAGVNHNGDIAVAKKLVEAAAAAGADMVKFQTFKAENLVSSLAKKADYQVNNTGNNDSQFEMLKKLELSEKDHQVLLDHCKKNNIQFISSAFDLESLAFLEKIGVQTIKIPSGEITNYPYLKMVGSYAKPVIMSTGMSTMEEIKAALEVLVKSGSSLENITVLHCSTEYPAPLKDVNLLAMNTIRKEFNVSVGYSDHTPGIEVSIAAVALGATIIEKHYTLDRKMQGPDHKASLEPDELKAMVTAIRNIELALGSSEKKVSDSEMRNRVAGRKSIHLSKELAKGSVLKESDLIMKRPGDGLSPMLLASVIGKSIKQALPMEHKLKLEDLN